jgi:hypothetical protein
MDKEYYKSLSKKERDSLKKTYRWGQKEFKGKRDSEIVNIGFDITVGELKDFLKKQLKILREIEND